jgi:hypothetical protein
VLSYQLVCACYPSSPLCPLVAALVGRLAALCVLLRSLTVPDPASRRRTIMAASLARPTFVATRFPHFGETFLNYFKVQFFCGLILYSGAQTLLESFGPNLCSHFHLCATTATKLCGLYILSVLNSPRGFFSRSRALPSFYLLLLYLGMGIFHFLSPGTQRVASCVSLGALPLVVVYGALVCECARICAPFTESSAVLTRFWASGPPKSISVTSATSYYLNSGYSPHSPLGFFPLPRASSFVFGASYSPLSEL